MIEDVRNLNLTEVGLRVLAQAVTDPKAAANSWWPDSPTGRVIAEREIKDLLLDIQRLKKRG